MTSITKDWFNDFRTATAFLTRVPMPHPDRPKPVNFARAHRVFPVVGAAIGIAVGLVYMGLLTLGLPNLGAAALALGASAILTGALHEDGLADIADGFGGGRDKAAKLEIMLDSRLGTYGTLILLVSFTAKASALAVLPVAAILPSLMASHALARGILPVLAMILPNARKEGLSATAGTPTPSTAAIAVSLAFVIAFLALPWIAALSAAFAAAASAVAVAAVAQRQIGGQTGDVLGGVEQVAETAILLLLAARMA